MSYDLTKPLGNNIFSYNQRKALWSDCTLFFSEPHDISTLDEITLGDFVVFEEIDHLSRLKSCSWLAYTYVISPRKDNQETSKSKSSTIIITDNHNHVLPYRLEIISQYNNDTSADVRNYVPTKTCEISLIHIDQHSDLWPNSNILNLNQIYDPQYRRDYAHLECNIGNFITPCIDSWLITEMIQIRTEYKLDEVARSRDREYKDTRLPNYSPTRLLILDIDMDFRAPEMSISDIDKTMNQVRSLMDRADLITIAISPYFIDQQLALELINKLLRPRLAK